MKRRALLQAAGASALVWAWPAQASLAADFETAIIRDDFVRVRELLQRGLDPNTLDSHGNPGVVRAMRNDSWRVAQVLLQAPGLRVNDANPQGETPLMLACIKGQLDLVRELLSLGARINQPGWAPLHYAASADAPHSLAIAQLLLDEPMGALDKKLRDRMQLEVVDILERVGATCVMVTHDQEEAMTMAGRIAIMNRGKFVQIGEPEEIYEHPTSRYSAEFIGSVNVFEGLLRERQADGLVIDSPGLMHPLKVDSDVSVVDNVPVHVALRPEKVMLCDEVPADGCNFAVGEVVHIAYLGDLSIFHVRLHSGQMISAQLQNAHRYRKGLPTWGDEVRLCWESDSCVVLTV